MSRALKFRAWDSFQNKYVAEGFHVIGEVTVFGIIDQIVHATFKERCEKMGHDGSLFCYNDFIIEQCTGLKDKNGVGCEAYFGDIAKDEFGNIFEIIDDYDFLSHLSHIWFEIIGNVHENKDLLK